LLRQYADPALTELPPELMKRGGAYYSTLATELVDAHCNDRGQVHVTNVPNQGAEPRWPGEWVIELPCRVDRQGIHPLPARSLPPACRGLVAQVKAYELHTVEAAVHGDRREAHLALLAHPLGPPASQISAVLADLLETNRAYLPLFE
jgi:6-phospho-beta-glucosidase